MNFIWKAALVPEGDRPEMEAQIRTELAYVYNDFSSESGTEDQQRAFDKEGAGKSIGTSFV